MSVVATYEGFKIVIHSILGSGQRLYEVVGIEDALYGRAEQTTISESKDIIKKYLGTYVEPVKVVTEMSEEMFAQLQAGTLAIYENERLKQQIADAAGEITDVRENMALETENLKTHIETITDDVTAKIKETTLSTLDTIKNIQSTIETMKATTAGIEDIRNTIKETTDRIGETTDILSGIEDVIKETTKITLGIPDIISNITAGYEDAISKLEDRLAAQGAAGWLKNIPLYVGAGVALVVGVKVLDVVK